MFKTMRPSILDTLFAPVTRLEGVGPKTGLAMANLLPTPAGQDEPRVASLLFHLPHAIIDRTKRPTIMAAVPGDIVTLGLRVDRHQPTPKHVPRAPYRVFCHDESGEIALTFFRAHGNWLERALPVGDDVIVSGRVEWFNGRASMVHPDHIVLASEAHTLPLLEPVYPLTAGVSGKVLMRAIHQAVTHIPDLPEWIEKSLVAREQFPTFGNSVRAVHQPDDPALIEPTSLPRRRLAYDELLANQLALALMRARIKKSAGRRLIGTGEMAVKIRQSFGHGLTGAQERTLQEISDDMGSQDRMLRLVQGDVGSGKTIVALLALIIAVEAGTQGALMAPTEVLARQHYATLLPLAEAAGISLEVMTGKDSAGDKRTKRARLAAGEIDIMIGTHALFQEGVEFRDLGLAVIDEQHRFGVHQRLLLAAKGQAPDMLVMTATPIPRTLVLTLYGDMDSSRLDEKPAGRLPIKTVSLAATKLDNLVRHVRDAVARGDKIYWICPLVEESDEVKATSVETRFEALAKIMGSQVGLIHGRMRSDEKDAAMAAFKNGETRVLVATTVIEVGIDVPDATIMIIENAERFGLAQLHQLRGRVGRSDKPSSCTLVFSEPLSETGRARLDIMRRTEDGFVLAEQDLKLRGQGEILGTRQSGSVASRLADLSVHGDLLSIARDDARLMLANDPGLSGERGSALRVLLYLFERDSAVRLLQAG
ncbi:MAG: ATP-dependent DNA helicase RecG [Pseudomonadota bacterium]